MSLRQQAKILGIAPSYLSMMKTGKLPWKPENKDRYDQLVNTFVNTQEFSNPTLAAGEAVLGRNNTMVELRRLELLPSSMPLTRSPN